MQTRCVPAALVLLWLGFRIASAEVAPFVLPWDDRQPSLTDLSALNRPISEPTRVQTDAEGHFRAGGERIRFLGINFAGDAPFMPTNKADAVAARLAKFGFNNVRFHHLDAPWATGGGLLQYTSARSREVNPAQLQRVHALVAALKAHGIYSDLNLLVGREYRRDDGLGAEVVGMDWKDQHILGCFNAAALALQQEYATRFLTPTNPFTGLTLAADPAVAFVEILNENGLLQKWCDGGLDRLPARYAADLRLRWNVWLADHYASEADLFTAWNLVDAPLEANFLKNPGFASGLANWSLEQHEGAVATFAKTTDFNGATAARLTVSKTSSAGWHVQFNQPGLPIARGQVYTLTFAAKADAATDLDVAIMQAHDPWQVIGFSRRVRLGTEWQVFTNVFIGALPVTGPAVDVNSRVNFGNLGTRLGSVWLANVRLQKGGQLGQPPAGTSLADRNLPNLLRAGDGYTGTAETRRDWVRCLRDLESAYYDTMVRHLRDACGYRGLIFGSIMANSPASVQSRLDVIDAHAYWQHPEFPGQAWDPVNWVVHNVSMVSATYSDNTLAGLSRQRIQGKPFTVTEYQHPSPSFYGSEGPLLLAAQAALQDWDGVWLFDYGPGYDTAGVGRIRGFFDTAQHPTKLANVVLAANLFRRGDLPRLTNEWIVPLGAEQEIGQLATQANAWSVFQSGPLGVPPERAFDTRLAVQLVPGSSSSTPSMPPAPSPDTLPVRWNLPSSTNGYVTISSARTKAAVGHLRDRVLRWGPVEARVFPERLSWASFGLTLMGGNDFTNGTFLVVSSSWVENTGQHWKNDQFDSVGDQWGTAPTRIEVVPFTLTLPVASARVRAWALDERGQRKAELATTAPGEGQTQIRPPAGTATLWYEVEVKPASPAAAGFEGWRQQEFTPEEQATETISGPGAMPNGDGVANFVKYAMGLPAKSPVDRRVLTQWGLTNTADGRFLWLEYRRRSLLPDASVRTLAGSGLSPGEWSTASERVVSETATATRVRSNLQIPPAEPGDGFLQVEVRPAP